MKLVRNLLAVAGVVGLVYWINERRKGNAEREGERIDRGVERAEAKVDRGVEEAEEALHGVS
mgnify:CR=1 FL=1